MTRKLSGITGIKEDVRTFLENTRVACSKTLIGIEVEMENAGEFSNRVNRLNHWSTVAEGSLRNNGLEIVTPPVMGADIISALDELDSTLAACQSKPAVSARTGLHVHLDFRSESVQSLFKFLVTYLVFEDMLFQHCSTGRDDNPYCLPLSQCDTVLDRLPDILSRSDNTALRSLRNFPKYMALNIKPLTTLGTVEFRAHEGCLDADKILQWINLLLSIKSFACSTSDSPQQLIDNVCLGAEEYYNKVFGEHQTIKYSEDIAEGMLEGARAAQYMYRVKELVGSPFEESLMYELYSLGEAEERPRDLNESALSKAVLDLEQQRLRTEQLLRG